MINVSVRCSSKKTGEAYDMIASAIEIMKRMIVKNGKVGLVFLPIKLMKFLMLYII
jgi:hypothetical protein